MFGHSNSIDWVALWVMMVNITVVAFILVKFNNLHNTRPCWGVPFNHTENVRSIDVRCLFVFSSDETGIWHCPPSLAGVRIAHTLLYF